LLGNSPVGGSPGALRKLYNADGKNQKKKKNLYVYVFGISYSLLQAHEFVDLFMSLGGLKIPYVFLTNGEFF